MTYLSFRTAAGHVLTIKAKSQKSLFLIINDALLAEARIEEKELSYPNYRRKRGLPTVDGGSEIRMSWSVRDELDRITNAAFRDLDEGILALAVRPDASSSKPKSLSWFRGDLRRIVVEPFPIFYTLRGQQGLKILRIGFPRWDKVSKPPQEIISRSSVQVVRIISHQLRAASQTHQDGLKRSYAANR